MHPLAQLQLELRQFALHLLPHCMPEHDELPVPVPSADVREAKTVEGRGLAIAPPLAIFGCKEWDHGTGYSQIHNFCRGTSSGGTMGGRGQVLGFCAES
jgi:hypothetical protein